MSDKPHSHNQEADRAATRDELKRQDITGLTLLGTGAATAAVGGLLGGIIGSGLTQSAILDGKTLADPTLRETIAKTAAPDLESVGKLDTLQDQIRMIRERVVELQSEPIWQQTLEAAQSEVPAAEVSVEPKDITPSHPTSRAEVIAQPSR